MNGNSFWLHYLAFEQLKLRRSVAIDYVATIMSYETVEEMKSVQKSRKHHDEIRMIARTMRLCVRTKEVSN